MKKILILLFSFSTFSSFTGPELVWVAIGDSITYLNDHLDETDHRVTKGYLSCVTEQIPNMHYINQGHNGWTAGRIADHIESLNLVKADVYSIFLGTNDWWQGRPLGTLENYQNDTGNNTVFGSFRIIIDKLYELNPQAKIVLITPMQRTDFIYIADPTNKAFGSYKAKDGQLLKDFAEAVIAIGKHANIPVVDLYNEPSLQIKNLVKYKRMKDKKGRYKNYRYPSSTGITFDPQNDDYPYPIDAINYTYDGLHPSDKGNVLIAKKVVDSFKKLGLGTM